MKGHLWMSDKERRRKSVFDGVKAGELTLKAGARVLGLSYRQCRRSYKRYGEEGDRGLVHRSRGRPSNQAKPAGFKRKVLQRYAERYGPLEIGPTLASEKLAEEGLAVHPETLRRWTLEQGLRCKQRKQAKHRSWRERKHHFGEWVQMDGSHHRWFGPERPQACLMNMVDDATGNVLSLMGEEETTELAMRALWMWIERHGIPRVLYVDGKNVYVTHREPTVDEQLADEPPLTAFGKACRKLGIEIVEARSAQAKGRVERKHGVFQDRFCKELALRGITRIATANKLLHNGFGEGINARFAVEPLHSQDYHRPLPPGIRLEDVFCIEHSRVVQNDWTIRFHNRRYQILKDNRPRPRPRNPVTVRVRLDGTLHLLYQGHVLRYETISPKDPPRQQGVKPGQSIPRDLSPGTQAQSRQKPADDHPWR